MRIRKFPSVTVLDDWKGHRASVSLLSRGSGDRVRSVGGLARDSTADLLEVLLAREKEEREKGLGMNMNIAGNGSVAVA